MTESASDSPHVIHVVEDEPSFRQLLADMLETDGFKVRAHDSAESFLDARPDEVPSVLMLDLHLPGMNGLDLVKQLSENGRTIPIIMFSGSADVRTAVRSMQMGVVDFLEKPVSMETLRKRARDAVSLAVKLKKHTEQVTPIREKLSRLSAREYEVLELLVQGYSSKEIARSLHLSERTVENHRANAMRKLEAKNAPDMVRMALFARSSM